MISVLVARHGVALTAHVSLESVIIVQHSNSIFYTDFTASASIVGSSGSTPLYFAANSHTNTVKTPLLHSAHAGQADKHRVVPEMLARKNGKEWTMEVLKVWLANKYRDCSARGRLGVGAGVGR
jgi:hypothetical protein